MTSKYLYSDQARTEAEQIAASLNVSVAQLGDDILKVAEWIDQAGNTGYSSGALERVGLPGYFLGADYKPAFDGILFYKEGESKRDLSGYMLRRNPPWMQVWCTRFGALTEAGRQRCEEYLMAIQLLEEQKAREAAQIKRPAEEFCEGKFAGFTTREIGIRYAMAALLAERHQDRYHNDSRRHYRERPDRFAHNVWYAQLVLLDGELGYRAKTGDLVARAILAAGEKYYINEADRIGILAGTIDACDAEFLDPLPPLPIVVHVRSREWRNCDPAEKVYIGRKMKEFPASPWGNPHKVGKEANRAAAIEAYEADLLRNPDLLGQIPDLRGKRYLGCWCKAQEIGMEDHACHGDVLVKYLTKSDDDLETLIQAALERGEA